MQADNNVEIVFILKSNMHALEDEIPARCMQL